MISAFLTWIKMMLKHYIPLPHRCVIALSGNDVEDFLQGLLTNDISKAKDQALYALLLTPQGKFLYDFFITPDKKGYLLDSNLAQKDAIITALTRYKLRAEVVIEDVSSL